MEKFNFKFYRNNRTQLSEICPWICMADDGIIKLKGEALMCAYEFIAPDIASSSIHKINSISTIFNNALIQLGENWTVQFELQRIESDYYPGSEFNNLAGYLIDKQRENNFKFNNKHYTNKYYLIFTYYTPSEVENKLKNSFFKKNKSINQNEKKIEEIKKNKNEEINFFKMNTSKIASILSTIIFIKKLNNDELASLVHTSVSFDWHKMNIPEENLLFLDEVLTDSDLDNSIPLKLGNKYIPIITIKSFPSVTLPAMFDIINKADCELRWSTRFCCYSKQSSLKRIEQVEKHYHSARKSIAQLAMETAMNTESTLENTASIALEQDSSEAKIELTMGNLGFGEYTSNVMVWNENLDTAEENAKYISGLISSCGFTTKEETLNALQAFLSMQPGNIYANRRRLLCSTGNVSHIIPISSIWAGLTENNFMKDICGTSHPHLCCSTEFGIPFYLNLNVKDVGHTWISGRTGAGKSTLLALLEVQWLKYPNSQVIIFDKGKSARNLTICCGGSYIEPGKDNISFQPLAEIDDYQGQSWACEFIELLLVEQKVVVTAGMRKSIFETIKLLSTKDVKSRTLTSFQQYCDYQNPETKENDIYNGIAPYTLDGQYGAIFDCEETNISLSDWTMIEMETLMNLSQNAVVPALDYLFLQCEKKFTGKPTLLVLDEAWVYFKNPIFAAKIVEWLKVLRKKNVFVIFATQEINDAVNSNIASTLVSQCVTKIFLADEEALTPMNKEVYKKFGLEDSEITLLSRMQKKRDYYYKSSMGTRCFQLDLDSLQLAILTCSIEEHKLLDKIENKFGKNTGVELVEEILKAKQIEYKYLI